MMMITSNKRTLKRRSLKMATSSKTGATASISGGRKAPSTREGSAKAMVADQISQAVQSTSNLLHLMQQSSPSQSHLVKLPKNLLAKASTIKNTEQVLEQMPRAISSLDAHIDSGLQSVSHLKTVIQLLANIESSQFKCLTSQPQQLPQEEAIKEEEDEEERPSEVSTVE